MSPNIEQKNYENFHNEVKKLGENVAEYIDSIFKNNKIDEDATLQTIAKEDPSFANKRYDSFLVNVTEALTSKVGTVEKIQNEQTRLQGVIENKLKELQNRAYGTKTNIENSKLSAEEKEYYRLLRPALSSARSSMAVMDALGVKKDANYTALEKTISEDKKLSPEQIRQLAQFQSNTFAIVNAQSLLTLLDILKNSGQKPSEFGSQIDKIEQDLKQLTLSFLQNPMQSRDIAKDIAMLRKSAETLKSGIVGIPADKLGGESSKNELLEGFKSLMPGYDTYAVIKNKGLDFSQYTLEDAAKIGLDVLSIIPAVKLLSVGLKVVKVIKVTNAISNGSRLAKAYNIGNITSEVGSVLIEGGWAIKDVIDKFNEYQKNKNNEELFNIIKTLGIVVISATTSNYLIDTKKMEKLGFPKEFIIRVVDWFGVSGVREAYLKHWKNIP